MGKLIARIMPMSCVDPCLFTDKVTGRCVGVYRDINGETWLANGRWSLFRVKTQTVYD